MKISSYKIFAIKLGIFSVTLAYLAGDLFVWRGVAWRSLHRDDEEVERAAAVVYGERISREQWERYVAEQNWLRGRSECSKAERTSMLLDMVRSAILRIRARYNDKNLPDFSEAAEQEVQRLATRAKSAEEFESDLASLGLTREGFTRRLAAAMKETAQLERAVRPLCEVTDEDVARHYELLKDELMSPAHRPLKHIYFCTMGEDVEEIRQRAQRVLEQLESGEAEFAELARRRSEDVRSAAQGGELGEVYDDASFPLPELGIFGEEALPTGQPVLRQSRWGWHILLAGEIEPARRLRPEEVRESLRTAIQSAQYELTTRAWFDAAIREAFQKKHLQIHAD